MGHLVAATRTLVLTLLAVTAGLCRQPQVLSVTPAGILALVVPGWGSWWNTPATCIPIQGTPPLVVSASNQVTRSQRGSTSPTKGLRGTRLVITCTGKSTNYGLGMMSTPCRTGTLPVLAGRLMSAVAAGLTGGLVPSCKPSAS